MEELSNVPKVTIIDRAGDTKAHKIDGIPCLFLSLFVSI